VLLILCYLLIAAMLNYAARQPMVILLPLLRYNRPWVLLTMPPRLRKYFHGLSPPPSPHGSVVLCRSIGTRAQPSPWSSKRKQLSHTQQLISTQLNPGQTAASTCHRPIYIYGLHLQCAIVSQSSDDMATTGKIYSLDRIDHAAF